MSDLDPRYYHNKLNEALQARASTGEALADAAMEFVQASTRFVEAYDAALKAGWSQKDLRALPDPTKPVKTTARRARKRRSEKPAENVGEQSDE